MWGIFVHFIEVQENIWKINIKTHKFSKVNEFGHHINFETTYCPQRKYQKEQFENIKNQEIKDFKQNQNSEEEGRHDQIDFKFEKLLKQMSSESMQCNGTVIKKRQLLKHSYLPQNLINQIFDLKHDFSQ